ncbi:phosphoadenosine phosphosulfate reductase family protein [Streptomyces sp. ME02-6987-2C]|uniref:phosphoadenosine phosphosulfate reductase domain-containing protein n=1 Tax=unclassified Streptomyces TaxID=2593676 RepID=UPI0029B2C20C|nr:MULTISPECIES: phosphoadenosine phosphosulfate reductase family protein [unclassified Streptomyces]MDX3345913.1 phosphoadenosine phosphosulfate reductase family protein [Streptomyces sp. ME02-6979A]MDX3365107.1 phosphoadenosine phosphosulfate reductase family protein [Streptomyces sp. ME02-6987-2C]MDX3404837.1 phosphoadenosine phosphosulfate reductase family protein [Streptomyces sp. ME02-6977A]MDX3421679.1 phosphoadenosine phosphosulfate reductase family protein [Streptomyces sp. ME02-6985-2
MTAPSQLALDLFAQEVPDLTSYQWIVANVSAGKDSMAMLAELVAHARAAGVMDRIVVVHADLGDAEWEGTRDLAAEHAAAYGLRFEVVARTGSGLIDRIEERGMFPSADNRWCTSDFKRGPVRRLFTALVRESEAAGHRGQVRILNVMGLRADESPARRKLLAFSHDGAWTCPCPECRRRRALAEDYKARGLKVPKHAKPGWGASNTLRHVDTWLPVHAWTAADVWTAVWESRLRIHPAYAAGMPRLSCVFCVLASRSALVRAAQLQPELAARYAAVEARIGHRFRLDVSMAEIIAEAATTREPPQVTCWQG